MVIARAGQFGVCVNSYIGGHKYMTHDISIVKYSEDGSSYVIAYFNEDGELTSCGDRLLSCLEDIGDLEYDEIRNLRQIAEIGSKIVMTENVESGYGEMITVKSHTYSQGKETPDRVRHYPLEKDISVWEVYDEDGVSYDHYWNEEDAAERAAELRAEDGKEYDYARVDVE